MIHTREYDEKGNEVPVGTFEARQELEGGRRELRDRFAMAALTGFLGSSRLASVVPSEIADAAYLVADAMLGARKK